MNPIMVHHRGEFLIGHKISIITQGSVTHSSFTKLTFARTVWSLEFGVWGLGLYNC